MLYIICIWALLEVTAAFLIYPKDDGSGPPWCYAQDIEKQIYWKLGQGASMELNGAHYKCTWNQCNKPHSSLRHAHCIIPDMDDHDPLYMTWAFSSPKEPVATGMTNRDVVCMGCYKDTQGLYHPRCNDLKPYLILEQQWCDETAALQK